MSGKNKNQEQAQATQNKAQAPQKNNVVSLAAVKCCVKDCKRQPQLQNFCTEHYDWFKFGLVTKTGEKPIDFDKKFQAYSARKKVA